jgi:hypothetical protein
MLNVIKLYVFIENFETNSEDKQKIGELMVIIILHINNIMICLLMYMIYS